MGNGNTGALAGVRVIDFGQYIAGPLVGQLLADSGAEVIRVDPVGGPRWNHDGNAVLHRGKKSIVLDLKDGADVETARRLINSADVVIENFRPGVMGRLGLGADEACELNPGLIYCSVPGFASDDERSGRYATEGVVAAEGGLYAPRDLDWEGTAPTVNTLPLASGMAAMIAANSIAAALISRERTGRGQCVEVSLFDAAYELTRTYIDTPPDGGHKPPKGFGSSLELPIARSYECADGRWIRLTWLEGRQAEDFARIVGLYDEWEKEGFFGVAVGRDFSDVDMINRYTKAVADVFITQTARYWEQTVGQIADLTVIQSAREYLLYDEQARATDNSIEVEDAEFGITRQVGSPLNFSKTPSAPGGRHALDSDRDQILAELEAIESATGREVPLAAPAGQLTGALEGFNVVDTAVLLAGPTAARLLGEYGAEVIHVGNPDWKGMDNFHFQVHGGKRTTMLNLKMDGAREVFHELVRNADVLSTNFSQSVAGRLGIGEATLRAMNPGLVYSRISAHGLVGPRAEFRGHEEIGQATTGVLERFSKSPKGNMQFVLVNDDGTGHIAAFGIMAALFHRIRTGEGQFVGTSLAQTSGFWQSIYLVDHRDRNWNDPGGLEYGGSGPLDHRYRASDGRWIYLSVDPSTPVSVLDGVAGLEGIGSVASDELQNELELRITMRPAEEWVAALNTVDPRVGASHFNSYEEAAEDPWALAHGLYVGVDFPDVGPGRIVGPAPRLSETPMRLGKPVGERGSDTREVLAEYGFADRTDQLIAEGAARDLPPVAKTVRK